MIDPQEISAVTKEIPGLAKAIETSGILLSVVIFCVLIFLIVKLVVTVKFKGKDNGRRSEGLNPGYVAQVQGHMASAIEANSKIERIDKNADELCKCMVVLANNQAQQTAILGKISDQQIRESGKAEGRG